MSKRNSKVKKNKANGKKVIILIIIFVALLALSIFLFFKVGSSVVQSGGSGSKSLIEPKIIGEFPPIIF